MKVQNIETQKLKRRETTARLDAYWSGITEQTETAANDGTEAEEDEHEEG